MYHRSPAEDREHARCERSALNSIDHQPVDHVVRSTVRESVRMRRKTSHPKISVYILCESGFSRIQVVAEPSGDEHVADDAHAVSEACEYANLDGCERKDVAMSEPERMIP